MPSYPLRPLRDASRLAAAVGAYIAFMVGATHLAGWLIGLLP